MLGLTNSNASKVIKSVETKGYVERIMGQDDKRQMYFIISKKGRDKIAEIKCEGKEVDAILNKIINKNVKL